MGQHNNHHGSSADGLSQRVNSPRYSGPMTRRALSFKRSNPTAQNNSTHSNGNNNGGSNSHSRSNSFGTQLEIDLHLNSPRSEINNNLVSFDGLESVVEKKPTLHHHNQATQRVRVRKYIGSVNVDLGLGLRGKKKLGHWMFLVFCGVCLFMGVLKICANGWFGSAIERSGFNQDVSDSTITHINLRDQISYGYGYGGEESHAKVEGNDVEQSLMMVASGIVSSRNDMVDVYGQNLIVRISLSALTGQKVTKSWIQRQMAIF